MVKGEKWSWANVSGMFACCSVYMYSVYVLKYNLIVMCVLLKELVVKE